MPKILLLDEPHPKAKEILSQFELISAKEYNEKYITEHESYWRGEINYDNFDGIYTQLTPVECNTPVFCPCTGVDHIKAKKVIYLDDKWKNSEGRLVTSTAEHTWSLILQLAKSKRMQLSRKTLGIIGYGRIGRMVAEYADAFKMNLNILAAMSDYFDCDMRETLLRESDIITLHIPLETNRGFIGAKEFALMKPGTLLVNTSRAEIVDEDALFNALDSGKIMYADDFKFSHTRVTEYFENIGKAIMTDHIGGSCDEAREMTDCYIAEKIREWFHA